MLTDQAPPNAPTEPDSSQVVRLSLSAHTTCSFALGKLSHRRPHSVQHLTKQHTCCVIELPLKFFLVASAFEGRFSFAVPEQLVIGAAANVRRNGGASRRATDNLWQQLLTPWIVRRHKAHGIVMSNLRPLLYFTLYPEKPLSSLGLTISSRKPNKHGPRIYC